MADLGGFVADLPSFKGGSVERKNLTLQFVKFIELATCSREGLCDPSPMLP